MLGRTIANSTLWLLCSITCIACQSSQFSVEFAPNQSSRARHISIFGVMRDGQMSRSGWDVLGPNVTPPFAGSACDLAYSESMFATWPELAGYVDQAIRSDGVSTELVSRLAPAAKGDTIMMLTIGGKARSASESGSSISSSLAPSGRASPMALDGTPAKHDGENSDASSVRVSATFFATGRPVREVARIELRYAGTEMSEALTMFRNKLESEFPDAHCSSWDLALAPH